MYLRTTKRRNRDGSTVVYYQLAHNVRDPESGKPVAQIIHSFGRADELDRADLVRLCQSIARVCGLAVHDPLADGKGAASPTSEKDELLAEGVRQLGTRPLGATWVIQELWERLGIGPAIRKLTGKQRPQLERALLAQAANRLCKPESKLGVWDRWLDGVYLPGCEGLVLRHMYEAMDLLHKHSEDVEEAVFFHTANLLNLEIDVVFYDTTTASFAIDDEDPDEDEDKPGLRKLGHSKEGTWTPQVVVALAVTRDGLPVRSWVLPGNTTDVTTIQRVRADLRGWKLGRALFVADSGMNSEENRQELAPACGYYVLACRLNSVKEVSEEVLGRAGRYKTVSENMRVKEVVVGDGEKRRRYIVCHNPAQARREASHRAEVIKELETELASHPDLDAQAKWASDLRSSGRFGRYVAVSRGKLRIDRAAIAAAARTDGKWVLITNDDTLSPEDAAQAYKGLLVIERCFRSLKTTQIKLRPMYHWLPRRIEAHIKICVLALLIQRVAERACGQTWPRLRRTLDKMQLTTYETATHRFLRTNDLPAEALAALESLQISPPKRILGVSPIPSAS